MILLSLWAFFQSVLTYFIIYGPHLMGALSYYVGRLNELGIPREDIFSFLAAIVAFKVVLAASIPFALKWIPDHWWQRFQKHFSGLQNQVAQAKPVRTSAWKGVPAGSYATAVFNLHGTYVFVLFFKRKVLGDSHDIHDSPYGHRHFDFLPHPSSLDQKAILCPEQVQSTTSAHLHNRIPGP